MWMMWGALSAFFLGFYNVSQKHAVNANSVLPVLFLSTAFGAALVLPAILVSPAYPGLMGGMGVYVARLSTENHLLIFLKALIVTVSWIFTFIALKRLPISIASPINASAPLWTLAGAVLLYHECPKLGQWAGVTVILLSYFAFSSLGKKEGIEFHRDKWVYLLLLGTVVGAVSGLYDKFLIQMVKVPPVALQAWFSVYLAVISGAIVLALLLSGRRRVVGPLSWRWSIPLIAAFLLFADFAYFRALDNEDAMIMVLTAVRRASVVVAFVAGAMLFKEKNKCKKAVALSGVLLGVLLILLS